jgi:REP element-mobilizing transposase RayT
MARPLRLEHSGALWHVTARGNRKEEIFLDDRDRHRFLDGLAKVVALCRWRLHAWVLMTNHYHLLIETPEPTLSRGMHLLNGRYSQGFNARHGRVGHVFQGRYKGILVEQEGHLLELTRYVVLNPVRAGLSHRAEEYPWSSYHETAGYRPRAEWLEVDGTLRHFGRDRREARRRFRAFVAEGGARGYRPWEQLEGQIYLGGEAFRRRVDRLLARRPAVLEVPRAQQALSPRPTLDQALNAVALAFGTTPLAIRSGRRGPARKAFALLGRRLWTARLGDVGAVLRVRHWSASHLASAGEVLEVGDGGFRERLAQARRLLDELANKQT